MSHTAQVWNIGKKFYNIGPWVYCNEPVFRLSKSCGQKNVLKFNRFILNIRKLSVCLFICPSVNLSFCMFNNSSVHVSVCSSVFVYIHTPPVHLSVYTSVCLVLLYVFTSIRLSTCLSACSICLSMHVLFVHTSVCSSVVVCIHPQPAYLSACTSVSLSGPLYVFPSVCHLFINQSTPIFAQLFCQSLCQSVCLLICLTVCLNLICSGISKVQSHESNYFNTNLKYLEILWQLSWNLFFK
jgi:hypothetical protein